MLSACVLLSAATVSQNLSSGTFLSHIHRCQPGLTQTLKFTDKGSSDPSSHSHPPPRQGVPWRNGHVCAGWGQGPSISLLGTSGAQKGHSSALHPEHGQCLSSGGREHLSEQLRHLPGGIRREATSQVLAPHPTRQHTPHTQRCHATCTDTKLLRLLVLKMVLCPCLRALPSL